MAERLQNLSCQHHEVQYFLLYCGKIPTDHVQDSYDYNYRVRYHPHLNYTDMDTLEEYETFLFLDILDCVIGKCGDATVYV